MENEGQWKWSDESSWKYENWIKGEPNNSGEGKEEHCAEWHKTGWNDDNCDGLQSFLCELTFY